VKQRTPLESPAKPRTPVCPWFTGVAVYAYEETLVFPEMLVAGIGFGGGPGWKLRL
jgi:hypothetical protein